jgi:hypothetical protein
MRGRVPLMAKLQMAIGFAMHRDHSLQNRLCTRRGYDWFRNAGLCLPTVLLCGPAARSSVLRSIKRTNHRFVPTGLGSSSISTQDYGLLSARAVQISAQMAFWTAQLAERVEENVDKRNRVGAVVCFRPSTSTLSLVEMDGRSCRELLDGRAHSRSLGYLRISCQASWCR